MSLLKGKRSAEADGS